jgi:hypothetical protein
MANDSPISVKDLHQGLTEAAAALAQYRVRYAPSSFSYAASAIGNHDGAA